MILYHGSNVEVQNPRIITTNRGLDFGSGFYLTSDVEQATRWSILKTKRRGSGMPIPVSYTHLTLPTILRV